MTLETFFLLSGTLSLVAVIPLACLIAVVCMLRAERRRADTMARELERLAEWIRDSIPKPADDPSALSDGELTQEVLAARIHAAVDLIHAATGAQPDDLALMLPQPASGAWRRGRAMTLETFLRNLGRTTP